MELSGTTTVYGVIGDPVSHSLSPVFQARFFEQYGLDAVYVPFHVVKENVDKVLDGLWAAGVAGLNITVPHKQAVLDRVDADADARCIGAVNTLRHESAGWQGVNTDWQGFRDVLHGMNAHVRGACVLLFGAGGTARAMLHALAREGAKTVRICNRSPERLHSLIDHAGRAYPDMSVEPVAWEQQAVSQACERAVLAVNATSIGLGEMPRTFPFSLCGKSSAVDAVYVPDGNTPFVMAARQAGCRALDGLPMLIAQGAASFHYWQQKKPARLPVLRWLEARLGRSAAGLPAWERMA